MRLRPAPKGGVAEDMKQILKGIFAIILFTFIVADRPEYACAQKARLSDIVVTNSDEDLLVYFSVEDCFTSEMNRAIKSGILTTFTFSVHVYERRDFWWDRKIVEVEAKHSIRYDQLKKRYEVKIAENSDQPVFVDDFQEAKRLMSEVAALEVVPLHRLDKGGRYQLRMKAEMDKIRLPLYLHYVLFFLSLWDFETDWYAVDFLY